MIPHDFGWLIPFFALLAAGLFAGFTAGMFGVGGGFVVVPAMLVILPLLGVIEKPDRVPATIEEDFNAHYGQGSGAHPAE